MADGSKIEWTEATWNPVTGCTKVSPGCDNCYAERIVNRFKGKGAFDKVELSEPKLSAPLKWRKPRRIFVNSMSDLFHDDVPDEFIARVWAVMAATPQHTYQILTKRHARMRSFLQDLCRCGAGHPPGTHLMSAMSWAATRGNPNWIPGLDSDVVAEATRGMTWGKVLPNVWLGVSVEDQKWADIRIPALLETPAAVRWLSCEPLLGPIDLSKWLGGTHASDLRRGRDLSGGGVGRDQNRQPWPCLADGDSSRQSLERRAEGVSPPESKAAGARHQAGGVPTGSVDGAERAALRDGASVGVAASPWSDSAGPDDQSQEWRQDRQSPRQPRAGELLRAANPCAGRPSSWSAESVWDVERYGEADDRAGARDLFTPGAGREVDRNRGRLRGGDADRVEGGQGRASISWLVLGGESGPGARPMELPWAESLVRQCQAAQVPTFVKQLGSRWGKNHHDIDAFPESLRVREYPQSVKP